ncbi:toxin-antitoxin system YwqK family antitoxin [Ichthyenterobacterium sp. W332]|uniref:Toxin-antitoxin system YwqK family antitoxin n=1 Tax=Microcosmobacter mediterraneus TaxID=3075607 RepID=A0ABU2YH72_9FLAO|nr:toxin-antitoxin system YwqK family antitoxin [Ichthyenterobacterium sp. W332]MDT0557130.1 toxin-antitoxin system YwqK family antitoxin [Ichthyenterobacterium sp. W332]
MIKQKRQTSIYFKIILTLFTTACFSQVSKNQLDINGKRHGYWSKNFHKTNQPRYEGQFNHGKEDGLFKFYTLYKGKSILSATKLFLEESDSVDVKFLSSKSKVLSEGKMIGKLFVGKWVYYHKNTDAVMTVEHYNDQGQLHGEKVTYYVNGKIAELINYNNGKKEGISKVYSEADILLKEVTFKDDVLEGKAIYYNASGQKASEGEYKDDKKFGIWKLYKNGKVDKEEDFSKIQVRRLPKKQQ